MRHTGKRRLRIRQYRTRGSRTLWKTIWLRLLKTLKRIYWIKVACRVQSWKKKAFCQNSDKFGYSFIKNDTMFIYILCMEHWKVLSATMIGRQVKFSNSRCSRMVKTTIFWPWWQHFNSFCFETLSFFPLSPFFCFYYAKKVGGRAWPLKLPGVTDPRFY